MQFTFFIVYFMHMLSVEVQGMNQQQQRDHQHLTTMDDYYKYPVCRPGSHLVSDEMCELCAEGHTYTEHYNRDISCQSCKVCGSKEVTVAACTITRNTRCHCAREFYRHPSGDCLSRQPVVPTPAGGAALRNRGAFVRPTPWSAQTTTDVAETSVAATTTLASSVRPPVTPEPCFQETITVENAVSGIPYVTDALLSSTAGDAFTTLSPVVTSTDQTDASAASVSVATFIMSEAIPTNVPTESPFVTNAVSRATTTATGDASSVVVSVAQSSTGDIGVGASSTVAAKEELVTTTASHSASATDDLTSTSTLGSATGVPKDAIRRSITDNAAGLSSSNETAEPGSSTAAATQAVVTEPLETASTMRLVNATDALCANTTCYVHSHIDVTSTTIGSDAKVHGGIVQDDCGVVHVDTDQCQPWKIATGVLIFIVVLQLLVIGFLLVSGAARRYVLRSNMTPTFQADSERSERTPHNTPEPEPERAASFPAESEAPEWTSRSSDLSLPEPKRNSVERSESVPSSEVISL